VFAVTRRIARHLTVATPVAVWRVTPRAIAPLWQVRARARALCLPAHGHDDAKGGTDTAYNGQ
jgi:hypothetical protein